RNDYPESVRALAVLWGSHFFWKPWGELGTAVTTGQPSFNRIYQESFFDYFARHVEDASIFNAAMTAVSRVDVSAVLEAYDFSRFSQMVDVGGGHGALLHGILSANRHLQGVLYDVPAVIAGATELRTGEVGTRCEVVAGNFFEIIPPGADLYILKRIVHDWN